MFETDLKYKNPIAVILSVFTMLALAANPEEIMSASSDALRLCVKNLIPSLFPFMVAAGIFVNSVNASTFSIFAPLLKSFFGISSCGAAALIPGIICGYPIGAGCACRLYKNKMISKSEAETLIAFANNSGPLFIIGAVGSGILHSAKIGAVLYAIHITSAVICGIILKPFTSSAAFNLKPDKLQKKSGFTDIVSDSTFTVLRICGFVVIFAVINKLIYPAVKILPSYMQCAVCAFLELTNAVDFTASAPYSLAQKLIIISGALGWAGLSVHMQVKSIVCDAKLSLKKYYIIRLISCAVSITLSYIVFTDMPSADFLNDGSLSTLIKLLETACIAIAVSAVFSSAACRRKKRAAR